LLLVNLGFFLKVENDHNRFDGEKLEQKADLLLYVSGRDEASELQDQVTEAAVKAKILARVA